MIRLTVRAKHQLRRHAALVAVLGVLLAICATTMPLLPTADAAAWPAVVQPAR